MLDRLDTAQRYLDAGIVPALFDSSPVDLAKAAQEAVFSGHALAETLQSEVIGAYMKAQGYTPKEYAGKYKPARMREDGKPDRRFHDYRKTPPDHPESKDKLDRKKLPKGEHPMVSAEGEPKAVPQAKPEAAQPEVAPTDLKSLVAPDENGQRPTVREVIRRLNLMGEDARFGLLRANPALLQVLQQVKYEFAMGMTAERPKAPRTKKPKPQAAGGPLSKPITVRNKPVPEPASEPKPPPRR